MELVLVIKQDKAGHNNLEQSCERKSDYSDFLIEFLVYCYILFWKVELLENNSLLFFVLNMNPYDFSIRNDAFSKNIKERFLMMKVSKKYVRYVYEVLFDWNKGPNIDLNLQKRRIKLYLLFDSKTEHINVSFQLPFYSVILKT